MTLPCVTVCSVVYWSCERWRVELLLLVLLQLCMRGKFLPVRMDCFDGFLKCTDGARAIGTLFYDRMCIPACCHDNLWKMGNLLGAKNSLWDV